MSEADWWICESCSSLNNLSARRCYSCAGKRPKRPLRASEALNYRPVVSWDGKVTLEPAGWPETVEEVAEDPPPLREPPRRSIIELGGLGPDGARIDLGPGGLGRIAVPIEPEYVEMPVDRPPTGPVAEPKPATAATHTVIDTDERHQDALDVPDAVTLPADRYVQARLSELVADFTDELGFGEQRDAGSIRAGLGQGDGTPLSGALGTPMMPPSDGAVASPAAAPPTVPVDRVTGARPASPAPTGPNASHRAESRNVSQSA